MLLPDAAVLIDVWPAHLIKKKDLVKFAAAARAASAAGWRYTVVAGWRRQVLTGLDTLSARRRRMTDRLGLHRELLELVQDRPRRFGERVRMWPRPGPERRCHVTPIDAIG